MLALSWGPRFETAITPIDSDHRKILGVFNDLVGAVQGGADGAAVETALARLVEHAKVHFRREETLLAAFGCPSGILDEHRLEHRALLAEIEALAATVVADRSHHVGADVLEFVRDWLSGHIQGMDRRCATMARSNVLQLL